MNIELLNTAGSIFLLLLFIFFPVLKFYRKKMILARNIIGASPATEPLPLERSAIAAAKSDLIPRYMSVEKDEEEELEVHYVDLPSEEELVDWIPDAESVLLQEAEKMVDEIQVAVDEAALNPPDKEEMSARLSGIVKRYPIFVNTEYYDAINHFIEVAIKRDTNIAYTKEELQHLWK